VNFHRIAVRRARLELGYSVAHQCPAFLPWHRKFLLLFEDAIRALAFPDFALPYWDWTDQAALDVMFADDFMGPITGDANDNYAVNTGPFRKGVFPLNVTPQPIGDGDDLNQGPWGHLTRGPKTIDLPTAEEITAMFAVDRYSAPPYDNSVDISESFNNYILGIPNTEGQLPFIHSAVHAHVGGSWDSTYFDSGFNEQDITFVGTMGVLDASPNDPVFFLHHCNVDRLWALWEDLYGAQYEPESGFNQGWNLNDEQLV
jgi:tyrosinase